MLNVIGVLFTALSYCSLLVFEILIRKSLFIQRKYYRCRTRTIVITEKYMLKILLGSA